MQSFDLLPSMLLPWFEQNKRDLPWRENTEPYRVWVSEIMLQQTRVEAVVGYYARFLTALPTVDALAAADTEKLVKLWEGLGYYSRVRNLQKAAKVIGEEYDGVFPSDYASIRKLPGIGPYTAGAIASICFGLPKAAVDGNVLRVTARYTNDDTPIEVSAFKKSVTERLERIYPLGACGTFTQALMELGATVCTPKSPKCDICPLRESCLAKKYETVSALPVKIPKKEKRLVEKTVFLLQYGKQYALRKRSQDGLLGGMWEFPNVDEPLSPTQALQQAERFGVCPQEMLRQVHRTHIFTHIRWEMVGYTIRCNTADRAFTWKTRAEIDESYALPTAFRIFLEEKP